MKHSNTKSKLKAYSLFSTSFLVTCTPSFGQVVYVNIDPDIILDIPGEQFTLDIDDNGEDDVKFFNSSFDFYMATPWWSYWTKQDIVANVLNENFELAALKNYVYYFSQNFYYPYAIASNNIINEELQFYNASFQLIAERTFYHVDNDVLFCDNCYWYNYFVPESIDKYLGFNVKNELGELRYGWIRCDVLDEGRTMIIKDYAYEQTPNNPILAGDTAHYVGVVSANEAIEPVVYCDNKTVYVSNLGKNCEVSIYNLNGSIVIKPQTITNSIAFNLQTFPTGIYLITFNNGNGVWSQKIRLK